MSNKNLPPFMLANSQKPSSLSSVTSKQNDSSIVSLELQEFARVYRSISPLIIKAIKGSDSRKELAKLTKAQEKLLLQTVRDIGLESDNELTNRARYEISKSISELLSKSDNIQVLQKDLSFVSTKIKTHIQEFVAERTDIVSDRDTYLLADNNATNLKLSAVKPALDFYRTLKSLSVSSESISTALKQQIDISIIMAKDICFNHDPKASLWDRELLFVSLISPCMDLVNDSWLSLLSKKYKKHEKQFFTVDAVASNLIKLKKSIEDQDMGHAEILDQSLSDIARAYISLIDFYTFVDIDYSVKSKLIKKQIDILDQLLSQAWDASIDNIRSYLSTLTEDDVNDWIKSEGSKPMSLDRLKDTFNLKKFKHLKTKVISVSFDDKDLTGESFYRLIQAWGLTDTLCKIRK